MKPIEIAATGKLTKAVGLRTSKSGKPWCSVSLAVDGGGETPDRQPETAWLRVAAFGADAEAVAAAPVGSAVYVEGRLTVQRWQPDDGPERTALSVAASRVEVLGQIGRRRPQAPKRNAPPEGSQDWQAPLDRDQPNDQIPF